MRSPLVRSLATVLSVGVLTSGALLTALWPHATLADDVASPLDDMAQDGTQLDDVVVTGEVVRDAKSKTGWVVEVRAQNKSDHEEAVALETDLERTIANTMSRAQPAPTAVWKNTETLTLAAGESVKRRYVVPAAIGAQLAANAHADTAHGRNAKNAPMATQTTYFGVTFQKAHA